MQEQAREEAEDGPGLELGHEVALSSRAGCSEDADSALPTDRQALSHPCAAPCWLRTQALIHSLSYRGGPPSSSSRRCVVTAAILGSKNLAAAGQLAWCIWVQQGCCPQVGDYGDICVQLKD
jgi:hypothetical protein